MCKGEQFVSYLSPNGSTQQVKEGSQGFTISPLMSSTVPTRSMWGQSCPGMERSSVVSRLSQLLDVRQTFRDTCCDLGVKEGGGGIYCTPNHLWVPTLCSFSRFLDFLSWFWPFGPWVGLSWS